MTRIAISLLLALGFPEEGADFYHDFRGKDVNKTVLRLIGPDAALRVKSEPEGLRVTIPVDATNLEPVGVVTAFSVKGDFEITAGYEILQADRPKEGSGVGVELYIMIEKSKEALAFYRIARVAEGDVYQFNRMTTKDGQRIISGQRTPTVVKSGQLRLKRQGTEVTFWAAEEAAEEFRNLHRYDLGGEDIKVWLRAYQGRAANAVDVRFKDLRIRSPEVPQANVVPMSEPAEEPPRGKALWILAGLFAGGLILGGIWVWWRRQKSAEVEEDVPPPSTPKKRVRRTDDES